MDSGVVIILMIVALGAVVITVAMLSAKYERERREALQMLADELHMRFDPAHNAGIPSRYHHFAFFRRGYGRVGFNTIQGTLQVEGMSLEITLGDYRFKEDSGSGKDRRTTTYNCSYAIARVPFPLAASIDLRREGFFDKIAGAIGFDDIDFESHEFSKKYHVQSNDKKFAYDLLDPRMIDWMLHECEPPAFSIAAGDLLLCSMSRWKPEQFRENVSWMGQFFERWPRHLVARLNSGATS